jgi:hypothetical protein
MLSRRIAEAAGEEGGVLYSLDVSILRLHCLDGKRLCLPAVVISRSWLLLLAPTTNT